MPSDLFALVHSHLTENDNQPLTLESNKPGLDGPVMLSNSFLSRLLDITIPRLGKKKKTSLIPQLVLKIRWDKEEPEKHCVRKNIGN